MGEVLKSDNLIGEGVHGQVYKKDEQTCIKKFKKEELFDEHLVEIEARLLKKLEENRIFPKYHRHGSDFIEMEYIEGKTLNKVFNMNGKLPSDWESKIREAFYYCLEKQIIIKDFHCGNVMVTTENEIRLVDVGSYEEFEKLTEYMVAEIRYAKKSWKKK